MFKNATHTTFKAACIKGKRTRWSLQLSKHCKINVLNQWWSSWWILHVAHCETEYPHMRTHTRSHSLLSERATPNTHMHLLKMPRCKLTFGSVNSNYLLKVTRAGFLLRGSCLLHACFGSTSPGPGINTHTICTCNCNMHSKGLRISALPTSHVFCLVWPVTC